MAKSKTATKKKAAVKKAVAPKVPFYAYLLTKQQTEGLKATTKVTDSLETKKFPNDHADVIYKKEAGAVYSFAGAATSKKSDQVVVTLKYPSDSEGDGITLKYPSDGDETVYKIEEIKKAGLITTRYPSDEYAVAVETIGNYKPIKSGVKIPLTKPSTDLLQTLKYPSDRDEDINW